MYGLMIHQHMESTGHQPEPTLGRVCCTLQATQENSRSKATSCMDAAEGNSVPADKNDRFSAWNYRLLKSGRIGACLSCSYTLLFNNHSWPKSGKEYWHKGASCFPKASKSTSLTPTFKNNHLSFGADPTVQGWK